MAEKSTFFNSVSGDRKYKAEDMAAHFAKVLSNGVFPSGTQLQVTENEGMIVKVSAGSAWINGYAYHNDSDYTLSFDAADGVLNRIDRVVVRWSRLNRAINLAIVKGTPASTPIAPAVTRTADNWELGIATVAINAGTTTITQSMITDTRLDSNVCGFVSSLIQPDTSGWFAQFGSAFNTWFETIEDVLDENTAGNLLNLINAHKAETASDAHNANNISIKDEDENFTATDVEGALSELFTNVSSGKNLVGTAITDVDPNVIVPTDPTFGELATAIGQISTGKKWASGQAGPIGSANRFINVSGLLFRPKIIIIYNSNYSSYTTTSGFILHAEGVSPSYTLEVAVKGNTTTASPLPTSYPLNITDDGFNINIYDGDQLREYGPIYWIAFE